MNFTTYSWVMVSDIDQNAITSIRTEFYLSESNTELRGGTWSTTPPPWQNGKYYWYKMITTFSDPDKESVETKPVCVTGVGSPGKGIVSITPEYAVNKDKNTPPSSDKGNWSEKPGIWIYGTYLWTRLKIVYTDNTTEYTKPVCDTSWEGISGIEIGGKNLLTNTTSVIAYDEKVSNWKWESWGTVTTNTIDKASDSIHIVTSVSGSGDEVDYGVAFSVKDMQFTRGEFYTFSVAIRGTFDLTAPFVAQINYTNELGEKVYNIESKTSWVNDGDGINDGINTFRFQRRFITFAIPDDYDEGVNDLRMIISSRKMDVFICRLQLERGNKPTDWKRSEEDIQSQISSVANSVSGVSSIVDKINGQITNKIWQTDMNEAINNYDGTTIKSIRENISQQEQILNGFKQEVKELQTTVETKADGSTVETLSQKLTSTEQSLNGFKQTVQDNYTTTDDLSKNYALKSYAEQLADRFYWLVESNSSSTSLTLTPEALQAITNQFIIKSPDGKYAIIENGIFSGEALKSNNYSAPTSSTGGYAASGTFYNLLDGSITSKNFVVDSSGNVKLKGTVYATNGSFTGDIVANSLTLGSGVSIDGSKISNLSYNQLTNKPNLSIYIQKDGTIGSIPSEGATGFKVSSSGLLQASNAIIYGTVYASAGEIGGCSISNGLLEVPAARITGYLNANQIGAGIITVDKITANNLQGLNGWINLNKGTFDYGNGKLKWDGSSLNIDGNGTFTGTVYANSGSFTGTVTATSGSFTGTVYANSGSIGGCDISNGLLEVPAANITGTLTADQIIVGSNSLQTQLDQMTSDISNAAKTATNFIKMDNTGLMVADVSHGMSGSNVLIANDGVNIRNGTTTVASFKKNEIDLGINSSETKINMCGGNGVITTTKRNEDISEYGGQLIDMFSILSPSNICLETQRDQNDLYTYSNIQMFTIFTPKISINASDGLGYGSSIVVKADRTRPNSNAVAFFADSSPEYNQVIIKPTETSFTRNIRCSDKIRAYEGFCCNEFDSSAIEKFINNILWSGSGLWPDNSQTVNFSQTVNSQPHGIILVFSYFNNGAKDERWHSFFIPKKQIENHNGQGYMFYLSDTPGTNFATKYIYIYNEKLVGNANNSIDGTGSNGVPYKNRMYVLRYVYGC